MSGPVLGTGDVTGNKTEEPAALVDLHARLSLSRHRKQRGGTSAITAVRGPKGNGLGPSSTD